MFINIFRNLHNKLIGLSATIARFDVLQNKLDEISISLKVVVAAVKNNEETSIDNA